MVKNIIKVKTLFAIFATIVLTSSFNDDAENKVESITMIVSSETGITYAWGDLDNSCPIECMLVKQNVNDKKWKLLYLGAIENFEYERGYEYTLSVLRTTLANPPADASCYTYRLKEILTRKCMVECSKDSIPAEGCCSH